MSLFAWVDKPFNSEKQSFNGAPCTGVGSTHNGEDRVTCYFRPNMTANNCLTNICISNRKPGIRTILGCLPVSRQDKAGQLSTTFHTIMVFLKSVRLYQSSRSVLPNAKARSSNCTPSYAHPWFEFNTVHFDGQCKTLIMSHYVPDSLRKMDKFSQFLSKWDK